MRGVRKRFMKCSTLFLDRFPRETFRRSYLHLLTLIVQVFRKPQQFPVIIKALTSMQPKYIKQGTRHFCYSCYARSWKASNLMEWKEREKHYSWWALPWTTRDSSLEVEEFKELFFLVCSICTNGKNIRHINKELVSWNHTLVLNPPSGFFRPPNFMALLHLKGMKEEGGSVVRWKKPTLGTKGEVATDCCNECVCGRSWKHTECLQFPNQTCNVLAQFFADRKALKT